MGSFLHNQFSQEPLDDGEGLNGGENQTVSRWDVASTAETFTRLRSLTMFHCCDSTQARRARRLNLHLQIYQLTFKLVSNSHLTELVRCRCCRRTLYKGPDNHTAWSCDDVKGGVISNEWNFTVCTLNQRSSHLLKEPIWRSLFMTAPSTSPKKSPV